MARTPGTARLTKIKDCRSNRHLRSLANGSSEPLRVRQQLSQAASGRDYGYGSERGAPIVHQDPHGWRRNLPGCHGHARPGPSGSRLDGELRECLGAWNSPASRSDRRYLMRLFHADSHNELCIGQHNKLHTKLFSKRHGLRNLLHCARFTAAGRNGHSLCKFNRQSFGVFNPHAGRRRPAHSGCDRGLDNAALQPFRRRSIVPHRHAEQRLHGWRRQHHLVFVVSVERVRLS